MRDDVFKEYWKTMVKIITYKEKDKSGNEEKCTISVNEAKAHPEKYKIYKFKHPELSGQSFAYNPEIVKRYTDTFKHLCSILPQRKEPIGYNITLKDLVNLDSDSKKLKKEMILGETFFAMSRECNIMKYISQPAKYPGKIDGTLREPIPTNYKEESSER